MFPILTKAFGFYSLSFVPSPILQNQTVYNKLTLQTPLIEDHHTMGFGDAGGGGWGYPEVTDLTPCLRWTEVLYNASEIDLR